METISLNNEATCGNHRIVQQSCQQVTAGLDLPHIKQETPHEYSPQYLELDGDGGISEAISVEQLKQENSGDGIDGSAVACGLKRKFKDKHLQQSNFKELSIESDEYVKSRGKVPENDVGVSLQDLARPGCSVWSAEIKQEAEDMASTVVHAKVEPHVNMDTEQCEIDFVEQSLYIYELGLDQLSDNKKRANHTSFNQTDIPSGDIEDKKLEIRDISSCNDGREAYTHEHCSFPTKDGNKSVKHVRIERDPTSDLYKCTECDYSTEWRTNFNKHVKAKHVANTGDNEYAGRELMTKQKSDLVQHAMWGSNSVEGRKCEEGDYTANQKRHLVKDFEAKHNPTSDVYKSAECDHSTENAAEIHKCTKCDCTNESSYVSIPSTEVKCDNKYDNKSLEPQKHAECYFGTELESVTTTQQAKSTTDNLKCESKPARLHKCPQCDYSTKYKRVLMEHFQAKHDADVETLKCTLCDYTTRWKKSLNEHVNVRHNPNAQPHKCAECGYTTNWRSVLSGHMKKHRLKRDGVSSELPKPAGGYVSTEPESVSPQQVESTSENAQCKIKSSGLHKCPQCDYATKYKRVLTEHFRAKHDAAVETLKCTLCDYTTRWAKSLTEHMKVRHDPNAQPHKCTECGYTTKWRSVLSGHMRKHRPKREGDLAKPVKYTVVKCTACDYTTRWRNALVQHFRLKHDADSEPHRCPACDYTNKLKKNVAQHFRIKHDANATVYRCPQCDYTTKWRQHLTDHFAARHDTAAVAHRCPHCDYSTKWRNNLAQHVRALHRPVGVVHRCPQCDYTSGWKKHVAQHFAAKHDPDVPVRKCPECDYTTKLVKNLAQHFAARHDTNAEVHRCPHCPFATKWKKHMVQHVRTRHDDNAVMHRCSACDYATKWRESLRKHYTVKHDADAVVYRCEQCEYTTKLKDQLVSHGAKHSGQVCKCIRCDYVTKEKRNLVNHFRKKHG